MIIYQYENRINQVSLITKVPRAMIAAVLFREIAFYNLADATDVARLNIGNVLKIKNKRFQDASIGLGQIFIEMAKDAEKTVMKMSPYTNKELKNRLLNDKINIYYVALVLQSAAKELKINLLGANESDIQKVLARYNGDGSKAGRYGKETFSYFLAFNKYFRNQSEVGIDG